LICVVVVVHFTANAQYVLVLMSVSAYKWFEANQIFASHKLYTATFSICK